MLKDLPLSNAYESRQQDCANSTAHYGKRSGGSLPFAPSVDDPPLCDRHQDRILAGSDPEKRRIRHQRLFAKSIARRRQKPCPVGTQRRR
jgi:hypothetical protein